MTPIPHGDIIIFSLTLAGLFRWFQATQDRNNFLFKLLRYDTVLKIRKKKRVHLVNRTSVLIENNISRALVGEGEIRSTSNLPTVKTPLGKGIWHKSHPLCPHTQGCLQNSFQVIFLPIPIYSQF